MTPEEQRTLAYKQVIQIYRFIPSPTYFFKVGEKVEVGCLQDAVISEILDGGKFYEIDFTDTEREFGQTIKKPHTKKFFPWLNIRPIQKVNETLIVKDDTFFRFLQQDIHSLLNKVYDFGVDFDPEYQRGYVWTPEDEVSLIDSIFDHIEIGKFVFVQNDIKAIYCYEILDGKQRLNTLTGFYENRFPYKGKYYNDLSSGDRDYFDRYPVTVAEADHLTREQKIRYFLKLNKTGKVMSSSDLKKAEDLLRSLAS